jgi:hypothetical protein
MEFRGKNYFSETEPPLVTCIEGGGGSCVQRREYTLKLGKVSLPRNGSERHSESLFILLVARNGIPSCVIFCGMIRNGIPRICIYFGSMEQNSELCSLPQKGSEQNNGTLLLFLFHGTEFRVVFFPRKGSERNSEIFCSAEQPEFRRK